MQQRYIAKLKYYSDSLHSHLLFQGTPSVCQFFVPVFPVSVIKQTITVAIITTITLMTNNVIENADVYFVLSSDDTTKMILFTDLIQ